MVGKRRVGKQSGSLNEVERYLTSLHVELARRGLALVEKVPDPVQIEKSLGASGKVLARPITSRLCDFIGSMSYGRMGGVKIARSVVGEAKLQSRSGSFGLGENLFKTHQKTCLLNHANQGAVVWVWARRTYQELKTKSVPMSDFLIPILPETGAPGFSLLEDASVKWEVLTPFKVPAGYTWYDACLVEGEPVWELYCREGWPAIVPLHKKALAMKRGGGGR